MSTGKASITLEWNNTSRKQCTSVPLHVTLFQAGVRLPHQTCRFQRAGSSPARLPGRCYRRYGKTTFETVIARPIDPERIQAVSAASMKDAPPLRGVFVIVGRVCARVQSRGAVFGFCCVFHLSCIMSFASFCSCRILPFAVCWRLLYFVGCCIFAVCCVLVAAFWGGGHFLLLRYFVDCCVFCCYSLVAFFTRYPGQGGMVVGKETRASNASFL